MLSKVIRIGLTALLFGVSVWQMIDGHIGNGIFILFLAALVLVTYFRNERILLAFWYLRKQDMDKTRRILSGIKNPEGSLIKSQLAYYYFLMGLIESQSGLGKAETLLKKALKTGLRQDYDVAMAKLQLAGIALSRRRKQEATLLLTEVKKLDKRGMLKDQIKMMNAQMKRM